MSSASSPRAYRSSLREQQARTTRARVLDAAGTLFSQHGFQATTMAAIAREAGVSAETVKATASKAELLLGAFERIFAGDEGQRSLADAPVSQGFADVAPDALVPAVLEVIATANERGHALWTVLMGAALSDPAVDDALRGILAQRRADYARLVDLLIDGGARIADPQAAAAELSFLLSPEGYQQLVVQSGFSREHYVAWLRRGVDRVAAGEN